MRHQHVLHIGSSSRGNTQGVRTVNGSAGPTCPTLQALVEALNPRFSDWVRWIAVKEPKLTAAWERLLYVFTSKCRRVVVVQLHKTQDWHARNIDIKCDDLYPTRSGLLENLHQRRFGRSSIHHERSRVFKNRVLNLRN